MLTMFCDMGGAGAVISAMAALADMKAPVNVVGIVAACENMISGHAYHNGTSSAAFPASSSRWSTPTRRAG